MPIISVTNQKGGVGKTTMLSSIAAILTERGYKVLCINLDPQRNLDMLAGPDVAIQLEDTTSPSILSVLRNEISLGEAIVKTPIGDLVRASSQLSSWTGQEVLSKSDFEMMKSDPTSLVEFLERRFSYMQKVPDTHVLRSHLNALKNDYDYIFLDTNPSLMLLTMNALYAADYILIPAFTDQFSLSAIRELWDTIRTINHFDLSHQLRIAGIVVTKSNPRTIIAKRYYEAFRKYAASMNTVLFDTKIRQSVAASEATTAGETIISYAPRDNVANDYRQLVDEFVERMKDLGRETHG